MDNLGYLFAVNVFVWGGIFVYVFSLTRRSHSLKKDLDLLKETLKKDSGNE
jgi:CcmD family protein